METPTVLQLATLAIAAVGAVLGVINTWNAISDRRPRARVRFLNLYDVPNVEHFGYSIEVTNLSTFPLTISEVGLSLSPWWKRDIERLLLRPDGRVGPSTPIKLEPREQADFRFIGRFRGKPPKPIQAVYAKTACGVIFRSNSALVKSIAVGSLGSDHSDAPFHLQ